MTAQREFLSGDRRRFAFKLAFHPDPDEGLGATLEDSLAWGSFEIWAGGQNLCEHAEQGEPVAAVHWYMLPWLEWLVANWDCLLHDSRLPIRNAAVDAWNSLAETAFPPDWSSPEEEERWHATWKQWWSRHCILAARHGGLFPNVFVRRWQDLVEVSWGPARLAGQPPHYVFLASKGYRRLGVEEVSVALYDVLEGAAAHLRKALPDSKRIGDLQASVRARTKTSRTRRMAILSGLGESAWREMENSVPASPSREAFEDIFVGEATDLAVTAAGSAALMFGSTSPTLSADDVNVLARTLIQLYSSQGEHQVLQNLVRPEPLENSDARPWHQGYALADEVLEQLSLPKAGTDSIDIEALCRDLGIRLGSLQLEDQSIRAVALAGSHHSPAIFLNERHDTHHWPSGKRFSLAHELCHLLFDRSYGRRLALASGPWAPRDVERRANSFAAELLMPATLIHRLKAEMVVSLASRAGILQLSSRLRTSFTATLEHVANLGLICESERERIRNEADSCQS